MHPEATDARPDARRPHKPTGVVPVDVVVATRPALVRDVLSRALEARLDLHVVALRPETDATDSVRRLRPAIVIIDEADSRSSREAAIRRLHRASPSTRIIVLTARPDEEGRRCADAGAYAVVQESSDLGTLVQMIESASAGKECEARLEGKSVEVFRGRGPARGDDRRLTTREWEVAELVAQGLRNKVIALRLNISVDTVKSHLNNSFRKLELQGRLALGILARGRLGAKADM